MQNQPRSVMLFAAGFGTRMGKLTANTPKPLLEVSGKSLLDRALEIIADASIPNIVINTHYQAEKIQQSIKGCQIKISDESGAILETGGGVRKALPLLGKGPIYTFNPDVVWRGPNPFRVLKDAWNPNIMDGLLLLIPKQIARSYGGGGDFSLIDRSIVIRGVEYVYSGAQIIKPDLLREIPEVSFSLNLLWDKFIQFKTLHGVIYNGDWCDVGTPQGLRLAEDMLAEDRHV